MPNYCSNCLLVYGSREDRDVFINKSLTVEDEDKYDLNLETFVPLGRGTYGEYIEKWGTKWNCVDTRVEKKDDFDEIYFRTAWCPYNTNVQKAMSELFPTLKFKLLYAEYGMGYYGYYKSEIVTQNEKVTVQISSEPGKSIQCLACSIDNGVFVFSAMRGGVDCEEYYEGDERYDKEDEDNNQRYYIVCDDKYEENIYNELLKTSG